MRAVEEALEETLVSEPRCSLRLSLVLSLVLSSAFSIDPQDSDEFCNCELEGDVPVSICGKGEEGRGVMSDVEVASDMEGIACIGLKRGCRSVFRSVFSLMLMIIFSRPMAVICFSLPLLRLNAESSLSSGTRFGFRVKGVPLVVCVCSASSDATESTLLDSSGTSFGLGLGREMLIAGVVARCGCASQQKVSLFHNLQLRFSSLFPS